MTELLQAPSVDQLSRIISIVAAPASLKRTFSLGSGIHDGTASCDLGALDASSARRQLQAKIAGPDFYKEPADVIAATLGRADRAQDELIAAMARWDELDSRATIKGS